MSTPVYVVDGARTPFLKARTYSYDAANELTATTDRLGRQRTYSYDNDGRTTSEKWLDGSGNIIRTLEAYVMFAVLNQVGSIS